ncbi:zinc finger BED domain-containing protein RICESLEEPER 2-like protein [Tanacetum coccineum]
MSSSSMEILEETTEEVKSSKNNKGKQPKARKKRSPVWNDFEQQKLKKGELPEDVKAMCLHCGELYLCHTRKYGITNLKNHLGRCTPYLEKKSKSQTHITFEGGDVNKMMAWKFDQNKSKRALAHMIVVDELPFSFVENSGFRHYQRINQPLFDVPCRGTITKECLTMYLEEKSKLRETLQKNIGRVCLTTDGWTSNKKKSYMALTAHFIDNEWNLVKKVLNFRELDGHRGIDIGKGVESCLSEWGFDNILSISVDNASANDSAIDFMKLILEKNYNCLLKGKWMHIRCAAHVVNLIVQDGMKKVDSSIEGIRCAVKWIKKSGARIEKFTKCAQSARCDSTKSLVLDCPTRRKGHSVPTSGDWIKAKKLCHFLKVFYEITLRISVTKYVTSHTLVNELATIRALLRKQLDCDIHGETPADKHLYDIAKVMQPKFDKYYCEVENMNLLVYFAFILDPRNKYDFLDVIMEDHYGTEGISVVAKKTDYIKGELKLFYEDYVRIHAPSSTTSSTSCKRQRTTDISDEPDHGDMLRSRMKRGQSSNSSTSELDKYVGEICEPFDKSVRFDILQWWKVNSQRFPILSLMARDVLAIPISTVASESVFSTSGRVLDSYRSSLGDKTIECLVCTQDWLRIGLNPQKDEDLDTIAQIEKALKEQEDTSSKQD